MNPRFDLTPIAVIRIFDFFRRTRVGLGFKLDLGEDLRGDRWPCPEASPK